MKRLLLLPLALTSTAAVAASPQLPRQAADQVSQERLHAIVEKLVSFGTRHALSSQTDPKRGIGAALDWAAEEFGRYSKACGNCLAVVRPSDTVTGRQNRLEAFGIVKRPQQMVRNMVDALGRKGARL